MAELDPASGTPILSVAYALAGQREQALTALSRAEKYSRGSHRVAAAHLALEDKDAALEELETAYKAHGSTLPWIRVHGGDFDGLRDDPRFQDLLRRMNLPL
jgi:hypothetical protein